MTYASGGLIQATDYNGFVASVNAIWGTGTSDSGYGQSSTLSTVAASNTVTATQWADLVNRINSARLHQTGSGSGLSAPTAGTTITYLSSLSSAISTITTDKLSFVAQGSSSTHTVTNATGWVSSSDMRVTFSFSSANAMRYFFNCGGEISFTCANSTLAGNSKSTDWDALCAALGTVRIRAQSSAKVGGSGTPSINNTNLGFYDLTTGVQAILQQYSTNATGGYNANYGEFQAWLDANHPSATVILVRIALIDNSSDVLDDVVTGTVQMDATITYPSTTYVSNVWGTGTSSTNFNSQG